MNPPPWISVKKLAKVDMAFPTPKAYFPKNPWFAFRLEMLKNFSRWRSFDHEPIFAYCSSLVSFYRKKLKVVFLTRCFFRQISCFMILELGTKREINLWDSRNLSALVMFLANITFHFLKELKLHLKLTLLKKWWNRQLDNWKKTTLNFYQQF